MLLLLVRQCFFPIASFKTRQPNFKIKLDVASYRELLLFLIKSESPKSQPYQNHSVGLVLQLPNWSLPAKGTLQYYHQNCHFGN